MAWISASQLPCAASPLGLMRRRAATASSSRSLDRSQRGELGMKNVNRMITTNFASGILNGHRWVARDGATHG